MTARTSVGAAALAVALSATGLRAQAAAAPDSHKRPAAAQHEEADAEHKIPASRVPAAVRDAFRHAYPNARVVGYASEVENGRTIYEVESRDGTTHRDLSYGADGTLLESETAVPPAQLPPAVRTAAEANGAHIQLAEVVVVAGQDTVYEIKIRGRQGELKLRRDGTPAPATRP